ncbi:MAG: lysine--tRNA ligase [Bacteroides sp.]|nr:MAG: lysine--tRNA ligase [Bacteroides sp.]
MNSNTNRINNLKNILKLNIDPYPPEQYKITHYINFIITNYIKFDSQNNITIAGRIMGKRVMGKTMFITIMDHTGKIQLYINKYNINDSCQYDLLIKKLLDIGDIIGVQGVVFLTKTNEITINVKNIKLLSKSLKDLPIVKKDSKGNIYDEFNNKELRYRNRYVDLIVNDKIKNIFYIRSIIIKIIRSFFDDNKWLEVETPILQNIYGGANAKPFYTYHNALNKKFYLRISNELYLKKLIVGGFEGVYEISKMFRNEGMDSTHNPEFTSLELYVAYKDYIWMMELVEKLLLKISCLIYDNSNIKLEKCNINFKKPYTKLTFYDAIKNICKIDMINSSYEDIKIYCNNNNIGITSGNRVDIALDIFDKKVQPKLIDPTFIIDYPYQSTPLAKKHRNNSSLVERFELFINGKEIANAYSEENNPIEQRNKLEKQLIENENSENILDEDFLNAMEYGMPPTSGLGIGIDRLIMIFTNQNSIQEVLLFPHMRDKNN